MGSTAPGDLVGAPGCWVSSREVTAVAEATGRSGRSSAAFVTARLGGLDEPVLAASVSA